MSVSHGTHRCGPPPPRFYDTLADHQFGGAPIIPQAGQTFNTATEITLIPPMYHLPQHLHYTLDGSDPTADSPVYNGPFVAVDTANLAVREINDHGVDSDITQGVITVHDTTPPMLMDVLGGNDLAAVDLKFSVPVSAATATDLSNYSVQPSGTIAKAELSADGRDVTLTLGSALTTGTTYAIAVHGIKDTASHRQPMMEPATHTFNPRNIVFTLRTARLPAMSAKPRSPGCH